MGQCCRYRRRHFMLLRLKSAKLAMRRTWEITTDYLVKQVSIEFQFIYWLLFWVVDHIWFVVTLMKKVERKMRPSTNTNLERPSYSSCHVQAACFLFYVTLDFLSFHSCSCVTVITPLIQMFHVLLFKFNLKGFFAYTLFNIIP